MTTGDLLCTNPKLCKHLSDYKLKHGLNGYKSIQNWLKAAPNGRISVCKSESQVPRCGFCNGYSGRFYICLVCYSISCSSHTLLHSESENGHSIAVDLERSELYCCLCSDQVYDPDFDRLVVSKTMNDMPNRSQAAFDGHVRRTSKRRKLNSLTDFDLGSSKKLVSIRDQRAKSCYPLGLRGLNNLGSTCFMNSVLQALIHAPPFRNYFLSGCHDSEICREKSMDRLCLTCNVGVIFNAVYSGDQTPYSPAQFLYSWWQHSANLASYEQQDAHEFFISVLDGIHEKEAPNKENADCQCIAHRVFSGMLRSDVSCTKCGFTSTTYDPFLDISLDMDTRNFSSTNIANKSAKPTENTNKCTLSSCLDLFTRPEKLGPDQKLYCRNCREKHDSVKQMSLKRLPLVLSLHIKRFEHSPVRKMSRKLDCHLQFPFSLDMSSYLSSSILRGRYGNRVFGFESDDVDYSSAEFEVFAVITHSGMLESGHYVTYIRLRNHWYKCDDAWITEVDESIVRASQCYMIFYVQKTLYYKANEDLSISSRNLFGPVNGYC